jgi:hypothetical protein
MSVTVQTDSYSPGVGTSNTLGLALLDSVNQEPVSNSIAQSPLIKLPDPVSVEPSAPSVNESAIVPL